MANRDQLFGMIEKGYPLPRDIPDDERATLSTAMLNTVLKEQKTNPARVKTAIKTLGRLGAAENGSTDAAPYLAGFVDGGASVRRG